MLQLIFVLFCLFTMIFVAFGVGKIRASIDGLLLGNSIAFGFIWVLSFLFILTSSLMSSIHIPDGVSSEHVLGTMDFSRKSWHWSSAKLMSNAETYFTVYFVLWGIFAGGSKLGKFAADRVIVWVFWVLHFAVSVAVVNALFSGYFVRDLVELKESPFLNLFFFYSAPTGVYATFFTVGAVTLLLVVGLVRLGVGLWFWVKQKK